MQWVLVLPPQAGATLSTIGSVPFRLRKSLDHRDSFLISLVSWTSMRKSGRSFDAGPRLDLDNLDLF